MLFITTIRGQDNAETLLEELKSNLNDTTRIDILEKLAISLQGSNPSEAILYAEKGLQIANKINDKARSGKMLKTIGIAYYYRGDFIETLNYWEEALSIFESINDSKGSANLLSNLGSVYASTGDQLKALEYHLQALKLAEQTNDSVRISTVYQNIGVVYYNLEKMDESLKYYTQSLKLCQLINNQQCVGLSFVNISEVYDHLDSLDKAVEFGNRALEILKANQDPLFLSAQIMVGRYKIRQGYYTDAFKIAEDAYKSSQKENQKGTMQLAKNLMGSVYLKNKNYSLASRQFQESIKLGENLGVTNDLVDAYEGYITAQDALKNYREAGIAKDSLIKLNYQIYNIDRDNSLSNLQLEYDLDKRESEIKLLNNEKEIQDLKLSEVTRNRDRFALLTALLVLFSGAIYWFYKKVNIERKRSDELLLNILPAQTAEELKKNGHTTAKSHNEVAIMFTDFEGFSKIAQQLSPQDLVKTIDYYFKKFDQISDKYNLEKIKTIGDSYLVTSGLTEGDDKVSNIVNAALEMQDFVNLMLVTPAPEVIQPFSMRLGIHIGPLVAGVVGVNKFQYDIWGNSVNIASRVESSSVPGRVAISEKLYDHIRLKPEYIFEKREDIHVKNIGSIQTYFVGAR